MPRITQQHEQEVRDRIVRAAISVFAEHGFHRATMQDIVRASGLSVGAIYTYFRSKSDLILAGCDLITDQELGELRDRLASVTGYRERIATAVGFWFDNIAVEQTDRGSGFLILQAWAEADTDPAIREMLLRRRRETVTAVALVLQEGVMRSELPAWLDVPSIAHALAALLDGVLIEASEDGAAYRRADAERRVLALIESLLAAAAAEPPVRIEPVPPRAYESARAPHAPRAPRVAS
jgi:TetR/AcrR family transcriptional regulator, transcriptional repressor of aconitase